MNARSVSLTPIERKLSLQQRVALVLAAHETASSDVRQQAIAVLEDDAAARKSGEAA
jgi:hypothetical protein